MAATTLALRSPSLRGDADSSRAIALARFLLLGGMAAEGNEEQGPDRRSCHSLAGPDGCAEAAGAGRRGGWPRSRRSICPLRPLRALPWSPAGGSLRTVGPSRIADGPAARNGQIRDPGFISSAPGEPHAASHGSA